MTVYIREAQIRDATHIQDIIALSLGDADTDIVQIKAILVMPEHFTGIAITQGRIAGFASGFITCDKNDKTRYELDLLAVHPDFHGQGIGRKLIQTSTHTGMHPGIAQARALVHINNIASQKAFSCAGYTLQAETHKLFVSGADFYGSAEAPEATHLIPVETLTYRGIWMEDTINKQGIAAAQTLKTQQNRDSSGAVVPVSDTTSIDVLKAADYECIGDYQWWVYNS